jgi:hypothetical protein
MSGYLHPDNLLDMGKAKMQRYHQEREALMLVREAQNFQPGRIRTAASRIVNHFRLWVLKVKKQFKFGRGGTRTRAYTIDSRVN